MDKIDLQELKAFREHNPKATIQDLEKVVETKIERESVLNELEWNLISIWSQLFSNFSQVARDNIEDIEKIDWDEKKLDFIIKESFKVYSTEKQRIEKENEEREKAEKKREDDLKKAELEAQKEEPKAI